MQVFQIHPEYDEFGNYRSAWVDDGTALMDLPLDRNGPVAGDWPTDLAFPIGKDEHRREVTDVLWSSEGLIFSARVREALSTELVNSVEWLPLHVLGHGQFYLLHPLRSIDLDPEAVVTKNSVSNNITVVEKYGFAEPDALPDCFMLNQAAGSAAAQAGFCMRGIYVTQRVRRILERFRGIGFSLVFDSEAK